jgi:hypothetical protein
LILIPGAGTPGLCLTVVRSSSSSSSNNSNSTLWVSLPDLVTTKLGLGGGGLYNCHCVCGACVRVCLYRSDGGAALQLTAVLSYRSPYPQAKSLVLIDLPALVFGWRVFRGSSIEWPPIMMG